MVLNKWNFKKHEYEDCIIPDEWNVPLYSADMDEIVNCPHCGKEIKFGETYTSRQFHNFVGLGYGVCETCYAKEWAEERKAKEDENRSNN